MKLSGLKTWWFSKGQYIWKDYRWAFIGLIAGAGLILGTIGWHGYYGMEGVGRHPQTWLSSFDAALGLFTLSVIPVDPMPTALVWARFLAPLALAATLVSGALVIYRSVAERTKAGRRKGHLLVIGCGLTGRNVAIEALGQGRHCVAIDLTTGHTFASELQELRIPVLPLLLDGAADMESSVVLRTLNAANARDAVEILVATGDDSMNARMARLVAELVRSGQGFFPDHRDWRGRRHLGSQNLDPQIFVESSKLDLVYWLQESLPRLGVDVIEWFNVKERGARDVLDKISTCVPAIAPGGSDSQTSPLLVIVGVTETAAAIAVQYCRTWACSITLGVDIIPRLVIVDDLRPGDAAGRDLMKRVLRDWGPKSTVAHSSRCEISTVDEIDDALAGEMPTAAIVAVEDDGRSVGAAWLVHHLAPKLHVWVCSIDMRGIASFALTDDNDKVHVTSIADVDLSIGRIRTGLGEDLARAIQGADYVERHKNALREGLDDPADRLWECLDDDQKEKNRAAVEGWRTALDKMGLRVVRRRAGVVPYEPDWIEKDFVAEYLHEAWRDVMNTRNLWPLLSDETSEEERRRQEANRKSWAELPQENRKWSVYQAGMLSHYLACFDYVIEECKWRIKFVEEVGKRYMELFETGVVGGGTDDDTWKAASEATRAANWESARAALVYVHRLQLTVVDFDERIAIAVIPSDAVEPVARTEHERWLQSKLAGGWNVGPRSEADRTHPDMVPWEELDGDTKEKDRVRIRAIPELLDGVKMHDRSVRLTIS